MTDAWKIDDAFREYPLDEVERQGDGYILKSDGWSLWVNDPGFAPVVGQTARYFGKGIGFPVRGVVVEGRVVFYKTAAEQDAIEAERSAQWKREQAEQDARVKASGRSEAAMREEDAPWPKTLEELTAYIQKQIDGPHDYGTCVYAMSLAATAAFNFVAGHLGTTGFQSSCADLDILRRTRGIKGPFMLIKAEDALYPQSDLREKLDEALAKWELWLADEAVKLLKDRDGAHPRVAAHWKALSEKAT